MKPIRISLVDDQSLFREGLHTSLSVQPGHVTNILRKLGVLDRTQAALRARDIGLI